MIKQSFTERVATEVRAELGRQRRSASWLAREVGLSQSTVSRRLTGELPFDLDQIEAVAACLNMPLSNFLRTDISSR